MATKPGIEFVDCSGFFGFPDPLLAIPSIGSKHYVDLGFGFAFNDNITARFGINNVGDINAPNMADAAFANNTDSFLYDVFGRSYYVNLSARFSSGSQHGGGAWNRGNDKNQAQGTRYRQCPHRHPPVRETDRQATSTGVSATGPGWTVNTESRRTSEDPETPVASLPGNGHVT